MKENLAQYAHRVATENRTAPPPQWVADIKTKQAKTICLFCDKQCKMFTSKAGNTYMSNRDKSPHRKYHECSNNWAEYQRLNILPSTKRT